MEFDYYLMWLLRLKGVGNVKSNLLIEHFSNAKNVFNATSSDLKYIDWISLDIKNQILSSDKKKIIEKYVNEMKDKKIKFLSIYDKNYPYLLKEIYDPPQALYYIGEFPTDLIPKIGVIGSRKCSDYGSSAAFNISKELAEREITVVSGMAAGLDTCAHKGAIAGAGQTIAVLGCGVDICYPLENANLRESIINNGCVISEYPPQTRPFAGNFPFRNRIISGLSKAIIVVEATLKSGTSITVNQALEQGREVYAVPGNIFSPFSKGTNDLIKEGASMLNSVDALIEEIGWKLYSNDLENKANIDYIKLEDEVEERKNKRNAKKNLIKQSVEDKEKSYLFVAEAYNENIIIEKETLDQSEKLIYDCFEDLPISVDDIINKCSFDVSMIQFVLTMLEIKSYIERLPGQKYIKI